MLGQYLITFRESFEAALLLSILLAYLANTGRMGYSRFVWAGTLAAVLASITAGLAIYVFVGELPELWLSLFEGAAALLAAAVLTWMILWMALKGGTMNEQIKRRMSGRLRGGFGLGLLGLSFVFVVREGLETVLFLTPYSINEPVPTMAGASLGILASLVFAYVMFWLNKRIDLKRFFFISSLLLIFLAAGLVGSGMHELFENREAAGEGSGWAGATAFDLGVPEGSVWHESGIAGSVLAVMFGYASKMEWGRVIAHLVYLAVFLPLTVTAYRSPKRLSEAWARLRASVSLTRKAPP